MSRRLAASDRKALLRLASTMEKGSSERRAILAGLEKSGASSAASFYKKNWKEIDSVIDSIEHRNKDVVNILIGLLHDDAGL